MREELGRLVAQCVALPGDATEMKDDLALGAEGLGLDSIAIVELLVACEKRWSAILPAELLEQVPLTVGAVLDTLIHSRRA